MKLTTLQEQAYLYITQQQYQAAVEILESNLNEDPQQIKSYLYLGLAKLLQKKITEAELIWLSAMSIIEETEIELFIADLITILTSFGKQFLEKFDFEIAQIISEQILEFDPENPEIFYYLGQSLSQQGEYDQAIQSWQKATEIKPDFLIAYQEQGKVYQKIENYQEAIKVYQQALTIEPNCLEIIYNLGICFNAINLLDQALEYFDSYLRIKPEASAILTEIGCIFLKKGELDQAIQYFKSGINCSFFWKNIYYQWAENFIKNNQANQQIKVNFELLKSLIQSNQDIQIYLVLGNLLLLNSQIDLANLCYQKILEKQPQLKIEIEAFIQTISQNYTLEKLEQKEVNHTPIPTGFYETTWNWLTTENPENSDYFLIYDCNIINLKSPQTIDQQIHFSFRFGNQIKLPPSFLAIIPQGRYWLNQNHSSSAVITPDHKILADLSPQFPALSPEHSDQHPSQHSIFQLSQLPPIQHRNETILVLSGLADNIYFHWMLEILPQLELVRLSGLDLNQIDKILVSNQLSFQQETLAKLKINPDQIFSINGTIHLQANQLIVPSLPGSLAWMPQWSCDFLRDTFLDQNLINNTKPIEKIYISRQNASNRRLINEAEVIDLLTELGFQTITLESLSVAEQAAIMNQAKIIVAVHGSGLTNLVFCRPHTKVIEIFSPNYVYHCYWLLSCLLELDYYYFLGTIPEGESLNKLFSPHERIEDIWVDLDRLKDQLSVVKLS
jgi:tetratricopeptide (TPR) repeat protein